HDERRLRDAQAVAAVRGGDRHAQPSTVSDGPVELGRVLVRLVPLHPVPVVEALRQRGHPGPDQLLVLGQREVQRVVTSPDGYRPSGYGHTDRCRDVRGSAYLAELRERDPEAVLMRAQV